MSIYPNFSIIVPVYNAEDYLSECVDSLINQTIGREHIEIVLVNDGSTDGSASICSAYADSNPGTVVYIEQKNSGVSAARNRGLDVSTGDYIGFVDSDDYVSLDLIEKVAKFFLNCSKNVSAVTVPVFNFGSKNSPHYLNKKFDQGTRIISLERPQWYSVVTRVSPAFFPAAAAKKYKFDESVTFFEDTKYVTELLKEKMLLGVVANCKYYYRRFDKDEGDDGPSLTSTAECKKTFYIDSPKKVTLQMLLDNLNEEKRVAPYFQYVALCEMRWRTFYNSSSESDVLSKEELLDYRKIDREILSYIEDDIILNFNLCSAWQKIYLLCIKHQRSVFDELAYDETASLIWKNKVLFYAPTQMKVNIISLAIEQDTFTLEGFCLGFLNEAVSLYARVNDKRVDLLFQDEVSVTQYDLFYADYSYQRCKFTLSCELNEDITKIGFYFKVADREYPVKKIGISSIKDIDPLRPAVLFNGNFIVRRFKDHLTAYRATPKNYIRLKLSLLKKKLSFVGKLSKGKK